MGDKAQAPLMGATAIRPPERKGAEAYTYILYDPKNGTILTRTPKSWGLIILFYCIYYSCLAAFWLACMKIFLTIQIQDPSNIKDAKPTWTMDKSIIGVRPGIGMRPLQTYEEVDSGIFELDMPDVISEDKMKEEYKKYKEENMIDDEKDKFIMENYLMNVKGSKGYAYRAKQFFQVYENNKENNIGKKCGEDDIVDGKYRKEGVDFCQFDTSELGDCQNFPYGYSKSGGFNPCVFVKMNRIMGLKPAPITNNTQDESVKKDEVSQKIIDLLVSNKEESEKNVYINCEGLAPADKEFVKINVYPKSKIPSAPPGLAKIPLKYFPYSKFMKDDEGRSANESPMIAVRFENLEKANGRLVHVMCKAFFHGVVHSKKDKAGLVQFEVFLNDKN